MAKVEIRSEVTGTVWKILVNEGDRVAEEDPLMILESMKMEIAVESTADGTVSSIVVKENDAISAGDLACIIDE
jgi:acetyl-CoA carboxylase biotin carboxyl carrier protein